MMRTMFPPRLGIRGEWKGRNRDREMADLDSKREVVEVDLGVVRKTVEMVVVDLGVEKEEEAATVIGTVVRADTEGVVVTVRSLTFRPDLDGSRKRVRTVGVRFLQRQRKAAELPISLLPKSRVARRWFCHPSKRRSPFLEKMRLPRRLE